MEIKYIYLDGRIRSTGTRPVALTTHAFNYGTAAFEGMRAFYDSEAGTWHLFRSRLHFERLCRATELLGLGFDMQYDEFMSILHQLIRKNNCRDDLYVRPIVFTPGEGIGLMSTESWRMGIFMEDKPLERRRPRTACLVSYRRPSDGSYAVKITGNYVLSYLAQREAISRNYNIGILLSDRGYLSEASAMNLFWRRGNVLHTPSLQCGPLEGITRRTIIELARQEPGLTVKEGAYRPSVLRSADEIFLSGTGTGITAVKRFEDVQLTTHRNSACNRLWRKYVRLVRTTID